jgi:hypothetical protein
VTTWRHCNKRNRDARLEVAAAKSLRIITQRIVVGRTHSAVAALHLAASSRNCKGGVFPRCLMAFAGRSAYKPLNVAVH